MNMITMRLPNMNTVTSLLFVFCCVSAVIAVNIIPNESAYAAYVKKYGKVHTHEGELTYLKNVAKIAAHNANPDKDYTMGINQFTDMTEEQLKAFKGSYSDSRPTGSHVEKYADLPSAAPDSWDWRQHGAVVGIKDQGQCGVCWAFASTSSVESAYFIDNKQLISLSESQQADCDTAGGCNECAFKWLQKNRPCTESSYSYQCPDNRGCKACTAAAPMIKSYAVVKQSNETALKLAIYDRPVAIGIAAAGDFMSYRSGVFTGSCPGGRDHAVVLVGYGSDNGKDFFILRNSWGTGWGENGYMRISRGKNGPDGICLIATDPSVPYFNK